MADPANKYKCKFCSKFFNREVKLLLHFERKHIPSSEESNPSSPPSGGDINGNINGRFTEEDDDSNWSSDLKCNPEDPNYQVDCLVQRFLKNVYSQNGVNGGVVGINGENRTDMEEGFVPPEEVYPMEGQEDEVSSTDLDALDDGVCEELLFAAPFLFQEVKFRDIKEKPLSHEEDKGRVKKKYNLKNRAPKQDYECIFCKKVFKNNNLALFNYHLNLHTGEKPYFCEYCDESFSCPNYLTKHVRKHVEPDRFFCPICSKGFREVHVLKSHVLIHSKIKPFACTQCDKKYVNKHHLTLHMRKHSGNIEIEKPCICEKCEKRFPNSRNLKLHVDKMHSSANCPKCHETFENKKLMIVHKNLVHLKPKKIKI